MNGQYDQFRLSHFRPVDENLSVAKGKGAVASVSRESTELAINVLKDGGNAFDAAFMLAFALAVYHPQAGNIGGGGYLIFKEKGSVKPTVFNYRECSPSGARRECFLNNDGSADPDFTAFGPRSVCVPGTVKAFFTLHKRYGVLKSRDLLLGLSPLALKGCRITDYQAQCLNRLRKRLSHSEESRHIYVKKGGKFRRGDSLSNPHFEKTLKILSREGEEAFYEGRIAEQIESDLTDNGGFVTVEDLKNYRIKVVEPIATEIKGAVVWTVPPEGGGAILIEILNILNRDSFFALEPLTPEYYHYLAQAFKIAFIDRMYYQGDITLDDNQPYNDIFNRKKSHQLFNNINGSRDIKTIDFLSLLHRESLLSLFDLDTGGGTETTHFSVIDHEGNAVSNSYTLNLRYGSKWSVKDAGFLMNGSIDGFSFQEGKPNYFGVIGNRPNLFKANKRPASNMAPVIVTRSNEVEMIIGTAGGPTIPTTLSAIILSVLGGNKYPPESVAEGRIHHQGWPDILYREGNETLIEKLHAVEEKEYIIEEKNEPVGDVHGIFRYEGEYLAVSDYRRAGYALSY